jgi:hypothetical protein
MLTYKNFKSENVTTESKNLAKGPDFEDCRWGGMWACVSGRWEPRTTSTGSEGGREGERKITHQQVLGTEWDCHCPGSGKFTPQEWERKERRDVRKSEGRISKNEGRDTPSLFAEDNG